MGDSNQATKLKEQSCLPALVDYADENYQALVDYADENYQALADYADENYQAFVDYADENYQALAEYLHTNSAALSKYLKKLDKKTRLYAKTWDESILMHYGYAVIDSISLSYSMFKYFFDMCIKNSKAMHNILLNPWVITAIVFESVCLAIFAIVATKYDNDKDDDESENKKIAGMAQAWPYFRDVLKGLKNAQKGSGSAIRIASLLINTDLLFLANPLAIALGIFAAANRYWLRDMTEKRKLMMNHNTTLIEEIRRKDSLTSKEREHYVFNAIQEQSNETRIIAYILVGTGGALDGFYLYFGVLTLAVISIPILHSLVAICILYNITCVITRLYEEYEFQQRLLITQTQCRFELIAKQLETSYLKFLELYNNPDKSAEEMLELAKLRKSIFWEIANFKATRVLLEKQSNHSFTSAFLLGLKNGLYAYGTLASIIFVISSVFPLLSIPFPPALLIFIATIGIACLIGFIIHSLIKNYTISPATQPIEFRPYDRLISLQKDIVNKEIKDHPSAQILKESVQDGLKINAATPMFCKEIFEVFRSFFSGFGKGQKLVSWIFTFLQTQNAKGDYQDSPILICIEIAVGLIAALIMALRAFAKGLGRPLLGQEEKKPKIDMNIDIKSCKPALVINSGSDLSEASDFFENAEELIPQYIPVKRILKPESSFLSSSNSVSNLLNVFNIFSSDTADRKRLTRSEGSIQFRTSAMH